MGIDTATSAKEAGLIISDRTQPGITRQVIEIPPKEEGGKVKLEWKYKFPDGKLLEDKSRITMLNSLAVPPAWTDVWFDKKGNGHIQATGYDGKGRLQYRYHPEWIKKRADDKFANVDEFAEKLSKLRKKVSKDIKMKGMPRDKTVALIIKLMDRYHVRVGSDEYAKENESYGLTTLQNGHFKYIKGSNDAFFKFTGKSGKEWKILVKDNELVELIKESRNVGVNKNKEELFRYEDEDGNDFDIKAEHINKYIQDATDSDYTAKQFRTWAASWKMAARLALISEASEEEILEIPKLYERAKKENLLELEPTILWKEDSMGKPVRLKKPEGLVKLAIKGVLPGKKYSERMATMIAIVDTVAADLGNTRAVCRSSYIRPMFLEDWEKGLFMERWKKSSKKDNASELSREESTAFHYMRTHE